MKNKYNKLIFVIRHKSYCNVKNVKKKQLKKVSVQK